MPEELDNADFEVKEVQSTVDPDNLSKEDNSYDKKENKKEKKAKENKKRSKEPSSDLKPKEKVLDKEISIKISPKKILKVISYILLLAVVFGAGMITNEFTDESLNMSSMKSFFTLKSDSNTTAVTNDAAKINAEEKTLEATEGEPTPAPPVEVEEEETTLVEEAPEEEPEEESSETIITEYKSVSVLFNDITIDWKETWGTITEVDISIKNDEGGTIKPDHFIMLMEGYPDTQEKIPLPLSGRTIKAGNIFSRRVPIPDGFSYSSVTLGDLSSVKVTLILYDKNEEMMSTVSKNFNLDGSS